MRNPTGLIMRLFPLVLALMTLFSCATTDELRRLEQGVSARLEHARARAYTLSVYRSSVQTNII